MAEKHIILKVTGMRCNGCSGRIKGALERINEVESALVDHTTGNADVTVSEDVSPQMLIETIDNLGYTASAE